LAFKLGSEKGLQAEGGNIRSKLRFKKEDASVPGTPVFRKSLGDGILGEANMDGSIYIDESVEPGSIEETQVLLHEQQHSTAMKLGSETYDDNAVYFKGEVWPRGDGWVMNPHTGQKFEEGDKSLPWEANKI